MINMVKVMNGSKKTSLKITFLLLLDILTCIFFVLGDYLTNF